MSIRRIILRIVYHLSPVIPDRLYLYVTYWAKLGKRLNLKKPTTFCEKLQWLKLFNRKTEYVKMADKYEAKDYVKSIIGNEYIIPTIGIWNHVDEIDWDSLPEKFVLKTTHDSGGVVICKDKAALDRNKTRKVLCKSLKRNYFLHSREWPYKYVPHRIIAEEYMEDISTKGDLSDYKFYCFNGQPKFCQVIRDRRTKETIDFYDMDWNHQEFVGLNPVARNGLTPVARPQKLNSMIEICTKLAANIPFVRIDLYNINNRIYFGEITFFPASGMGVFTPNEWDAILGSYISIDSQNMEKV